MKKIKITLFIFLILGTIQFANANDLNFKSSHLTRAIEIFKVFSPELASEGSVEVNYCGTYGSSFTLKKFDAKSFAQNFAFQPTYINIKDTVDFTALELSSEQLEKLSSELDSLDDFEQVSTGNALSLDLRDGVPHGWYTGAVAIWDFSTNEYLVFGGSTWQDDCD